MSKREALKLARDAAAFLYEEDPEWVEGGCSDVSEVISEFLRGQGYEAKAIYGVAKRGREESFYHAWMEVMGERFDPVLWVRGRKLSEYRYEVKPRVKAALACDIEIQVEDWVPVLEDALLS